MAGSGAAFGVEDMNLQGDGAHGDARQAFGAFDVRHAITAAKPEEVLVLNRELLEREGRTGVFIQAERQETAWLEQQGEGSTSMDCWEHEHKALK